MPHGVEDVVVAGSVMSWLWGICQGIVVADDTRAAIVDAKDGCVVGGWNRGISSGCYRSGTWRVDLT